MLTKYRIVASNEPQWITCSLKNLRKESLTTNLGTIITQPFHSPSNGIRPSAISFLTFVSFQILMNVIAIFTTVAIMPTVSTQTGRLFAIVVVDFLETE